MTQVEAVVTDETLASVVEQVWEALFHAPPLPTEASDVEGEMTAWVDIHGAWRATVTLTCSAAAAESVTRGMLAAVHHVHGDPDVEDVEDAMSELINMIGGNVKSLVEECALGLPSYADTSYCPTPASEIVATQTIEHDTHQITFAVRQHTPTSGTTEESS